MIAAILLSRFNGRSISDMCAMGGITVDDFTNSVAYREIYGLGRQEGQREGRQEGQQEGRQAEAAAMTQRLLQRRFGPLAGPPKSLSAQPPAGLPAVALVGGNGLLLCPKLRMFQLITPHRPI